MAARKVAARPEPFSVQGIPIAGVANGLKPQPGADSNQDQIDQRDQGSSDPGDDQGIVGADVAPGTER